MKASIRISYWPFSLVTVIFLVMKYFGVAFVDTPYWVALVILGLPLAIGFLFIAIFVMWGFRK